MKAFVWSVVGAVVSAILIYFVDAYLQKQDSSGRLKVEYNITDNYLSLKKTDLQQILQNMGEYTENVTVAEVTVKNIGTDAITNQAAVVRIGSVSDLSGGILRTGSIKLPGEDPDGVTFKPQKDRVDIIYKLLNPGEEHRFWIAYDGLAVPSFTMRRQGLSLQEPDPILRDDSWDLGDWLLMLVVLLLLFIVGVWAGYATANSELKARGYDLDAMLKEPKRSSDAKCE